MRDPAGKCDVCGLSGFPEASLSITEAGSTCQGCYFKWEQAQREQMLAAEREAASAHRKVRVRLLLALALTFIILAIIKSCGH